MYEKSPLEKFVKNDEFEKAKEYIYQLERGDYHDAEQLIFEVLRENPEKIPQDLIDLILQIFLDTRKDSNHGHWVHSLSHFTEILWELEQYEWIKKFNLVAFQGTIKTRDANCCGRLVTDFTMYAKWDQKMEDFHLTPENLVWFGWDRSDIDDLCEARMEAGNFEDEASYLKWKEQNVPVRVRIKC